MNNFIDNLVQRSAGMPATVTVQPPFTPSFPPVLSVMPAVGIMPLDAAMSELSPVETVAPPDVPEAAMPLGLPQIETRPPPSAPSPSPPATGGLETPIPVLTSASIHPGALPTTPAPVAALPEVQSAVAFSLARSDTVPRLTTPVEPVPVRSPGQALSAPHAAPNMLPTVEDATALGPRLTAAPPSTDNVLVPSQPRLDTPTRVELRALVTPMASAATPPAPVSEASESVAETPPMPAPAVSARLITQVTPTPTPFSTAPLPSIAAAHEPRVETTIDATLRPPVFETSVPSLKTPIEPLVETLDRLSETLQRPVPSQTVLPDAARSVTPVVLEPGASVIPVIVPTPDAPAPAVVTRIEPVSPEMTRRGQPTPRPSAVQPPTLLIAAGHSATPAERPAIRIRIGTIEVRATTPAPVQTPAPARVPTLRGFDDYVSVRNYINWERTEG